MTILKNKILVSVALLAIALIGSMLPFILTVTTLLSTLLITAIYFIVQNYTINYKYYLSFIAQLLGLVLIVTSFVLVFIVTTGLTIL